MAAPNSSSPPPRQPSPAKSFRSRVGTMLRRNSAINAMRPASPFRSESRASLKADASAQVSETVTRPRASSTSAIASPALSTSPPSHSHIGPSPLAKEATQPSPAPPLVPLAPEPESKAPTVAAPPQIPPAVEAVVEPPKAAEEPPAPAQEAQVPPKPPVVEEAPVPSTQPEPEEIPSVSDLAPVLLASPPRTPEVKPTVIQERPADIFAWGDDLRPSKKSSLSSIPARAATPEPPKPETAASSVFEITQTESPQKAEEHNHLAPETLVWRDSPESHTISPKGSIPSLAKESTRQEPLVASPQSIPQDLSRKDSSKSSLASSYGQVLISAPGRRVSVSVDPSSSHGYESLRGRSRASSVRCVANQSSLSLRD